MPVSLLAHIGGIPVQESLPFLVPIVALVLYGRHRGRARRQEVKQLPDAAEMLDEALADRIVAEWAKGRHTGVAARHVALMYPPGPDGASAAELASRTGEDLDTVERLLAELHDLGYVDLDGPEGPAQGASLTLEGYDLLDVAESVLLDAARERGPRRVPRPEPSEGVTRPQWARNGGAGSYRDTHEVRTRAGRHARHARGDRAAGGLRLGGALGRRRRRAARAGQPDRPAADRRVRPTGDRTGAPGEPTAYSSSKSPARSSCWSHGHRRPKPFLDITSNVNSSSERAGLLSMAFAPDYRHAAGASTSTTPSSNNDRARRAVPPGRRRPEHRTRRAHATC